MSKQTVLYQQHIDAGAKMVDFAGWQMPMHYGSQIEEHHKVRQSAGMFDVSHMGVVDVKGEDAQKFLRYVLANDVQKLAGQNTALYSCMLNEQGGVIDDLIVYWLAKDWYRIVINAGRRQEDVEWLQKNAKNFAVQIQLHDDLAIIAVQGPAAVQIIQETIPANHNNVSNLKRFHTLFIDDIQIARTGYTGEDGVEIILPKQKAADLWKKLLAKNVAPCGLGARDTLRLEAGMNLYGVDMNETTSPLISNLAWTISWKDENRDFIGKKALLAEQQRGIDQKVIGLIMEEAGVLRNHQKVFFTENGEGEITSGSFSPTLGYAIALARVPMHADEPAFIERRSKKIPVKIVKPKFI